MQALSLWFTWHFVAEHIFLITMHIQINNPGPEAQNRQGYQPNIYYLLNHASRGYDVRLVPMTILSLLQLQAQDYFFEYSYERF